jgi:hypothetical protein
VRERLMVTVLACGLTLLGFCVVYGYWGVQLWTHFGNPIYPFYDAAFEGLRHWAGWSE